MDISINESVQNNALSLLSLSESFETQPPQQDMDLLQDFQLLGSLGSVAHESLNELSHSNEPPDEEPVPLNAEMKAEIQATAPPQQSASQNTAQQMPSDAQLIEALRNLQNSKSFRRNSSGICQPILRPEKL